MVISLVFFPEKSHGQRSLEIYSPWGCKRVGHAERLHFCTSQEELPYVQGQGQRPRVPDCDGTGMAERSYPASEVRGGNERSYPTSEVGAAAGKGYPTPLSPRPGAVGWRSYPTPLSPRPGAAAGRTNHTPEAWGGGREDQPHIQGAVAALVQKGLEELSHMEGQEGRW